MSLLGTKREQRTILWGKTVRRDYHSLSYRLRDPKTCGASTHTGVDRVVLWWRKRVKIREVWTVRFSVCRARVPSIRISILSWCVRRYTPQVLFPSPLDLGDQDDPEHALPCSKGLPLLSCFFPFIDLSSTVTRPPVVPSRLPTKHRLLHRPSTVVTKKKKKPTNKLCKK